ncbi:MAG: T9SS type A sorting domain-containing protein [Bacteroidetes bacterium]|nr:T9SS type A sorting domain-containing protein [Bacteroidota bacterium]MBT6688153.1 T9SS type A sorting domain-containing protein [Bacteroidota bacterium]MBT7141704.1 T9SS type A sorting domain-containing protein [Bacteroidota bacterium]MBT7490212.1 T9SS type A sorting domain-containing protein [Bacteroidota bacterium]
MQKVISTSADGAKSVFAADLDGDNDNDIISASFFDDKIAWHKNSGGGNFGTEQIVSSFADGANTVFACDLDGDFDIDLISATTNYILKHENLGNGNFGIQQLIASATNITLVHAADLDGDLDNDVIYSNTYISTISWCENDGIGNFSSPQTIFSNNGANSVFAIDIDGDNDNDLVYGAYIASTNSNIIAWFENDGTGNFGSQQVISTFVNDVKSVYSIDIDNDGDNDVLSASMSDDKIAWYENDGMGNFGIQQIISTDPDGPRYVFAKDIDNDGDNDVLSASYYDDKIAWHENTLLNFIDSFTICGTDSVQFGNNWVNSSGYHYDSLQNYLGGDSINFIYVDAYPIFSEFFTVEICENETYEFYGQLLDSAGTYSENFQTINGCDSIEELILIVNPLPTILIEPFNPDSVSLNSGLVNLPNVLPAGGTFSGSGISGNSFDPQIAGIGTFWISYFYTDPNTNCTNSDSVQITVFDDTGIKSLANKQIEIFPNPSYGKFTIEGYNLHSVEIRNITGKIVKQFSIDNKKSTIINLKEQAKGIYFVKVVGSRFVEFRKLVLI